MNQLFVFAVHNTAVALLLSLFVYGLTRVWRNPPVAHVLWLLVLLKLVAPPLLRVDWPHLNLWGPATSAGESLATIADTDGPQRAVDVELVSPEVEVVSQTNVLAPAAEGLWTRRRESMTAALEAFWNLAGPTLLGLWICGAIGYALIAGLRIIRFERELRETLPASERLQGIAADIADKLGLARAPSVRYVERAVVPLLWCAGGRPTIVLPTRLLSELDDQGIALILAHELAHLRRRDHWVRIGELLIAVVYWWNPLIGILRRQIHQAEDLCCDAWVRCVFPESMKRYAEVLLQAAESLGPSQGLPRGLPASPFLQSHSLKARIEMILESRFTPFVSKRSLLVVAIMAFLVLPAFVQVTQSEARADLKDKSPAATDRKADASATSEFPYVVKFEQGATQFADGDNITILEVRGTAETFVPGNIYWIKGTYKLASQERAGLSAYTTAREAKDGTGPSLTVQSVRVDKGEGTFTLFLPMTCSGWPHISFYPVEHGSSFGGNYFGTGDSVLKRWWGTK